MRIEYPKELLPYQKVEVRPETVGFHAWNPALTSNSPSRNTMMSSHASARLVTSGTELTYVLSGVEVEYSKYTTSDRIPFDARVFQVIDRYPPGITEQSLKFNPEKLVIIVDDETGMYDVVPVPYFKSFHQYFGYRNKINSRLETLSPGNRLAKDTVLGDTPGNIGRFYSMTTNLNCMLASPDTVAEDSILVSEEARPKLEYRVYERRSFSVGSRKFPVNIGQGDEYKCFYDIGEETDDDGAMAFLREFAEGLSPVTMSRSSTRTINYIFDEAVYARQGYRGKVVDIKVIGNAGNHCSLPPQMTVQLERYRQAYIRFNEELLACERRIGQESFKRFGTSTPYLSDRLHAMLVTARGVCDANRSGNEKPLQGIMNKTPLDDYHIEMIIEYTLRPTLGGKLSSVNGDKGVITAFLPRSRMPVDKEGNIADIVMASDGTVARTNYARQFLMQGGASAVKGHKVLMEMTGLREDASLEDVEYLSENIRDKAWKFLVDLNDCVNPELAEKMERLPQSKKILHLWQSIKDGVRFVRPVDCKKPWSHAAIDLENFMPTCYDVISHQLIEAGRTEVTKNKIVIAPLPIMLHDKTAEDTLTVATAAHGPFGVLIKHNQADKYRTPWKDSPARTVLGESEFRVMLTHKMDPEMGVDMMDRANNPAVQKEMAAQFVMSETPGNIESLIDRTKIDYGDTRPLGIGNNFFQSYGFKVKYVPEQDSED